VNPLRLVFGTAAIHFGGFQRGVSIRPMATTGQL